MNFLHAPRSGRSRNLCGDRLDKKCRLRTWRVLGALALTCTSLGLAGCGGSPGPAATPAGNPRISSAAASTNGIAGGTNTVALVPQSVFHIDPRFGKDPFFPGASRSVAKAAGAAPAPVLLPLVSYLKLAGVRPGTRRPMALINSTSFSPGEEGKVSIVVSNQLSQAEVQKLNIRCLEIRPDSVLITIAGEAGVKELRFVQGK